MDDLEKTEVLRHILLTYLVEAGLVEQLKGRFGSVDNWMPPASELMAAAKSVGVCRHKQPTKEGIFGACTYCEIRACMEAIFTRMAVYLGLPDKDAKDVARELGDKEETRRGLVPS